MVRAADTQEVGAAFGTANWIAPEPFRSVGFPWVEAVEPRGARPAFGAAAGATARARQKRNLRGARGIAFDPRKRCPRVPSCAGGRLNPRCAHAAGVSEEAFPSDVRRIVHHAWWDTLRGWARIFLFDPSHV